MTYIYLVQKCFKRDSPITLRAYDSYEKAHEHLLKHISYFDDRYKKTSENRWTDNSEDVFITALEVY